jgi:hypothetical protein
MPHELALFEIRLRQRRRACRWVLCTTDGRALMQGSEGSRAAAGYQANRALLLMLLASASRLARLEKRSGSLWRPSRQSIDTLAADGLERTPAGREFLPQA